jgi:hypothetical protein
MIRTKTILGRLVPDLDIYTHGDGCPRPEILIHASTPSVPTAGRIGRYLVVSYEVAVRNPNAVIVKVVNQNTGMIFPNVQTILDFVSGNIYVFRPTWSIDRSGGHTTLIPSFTFSDSETKIFAEAVTAQLGDLFKEKFAMVQLAFDEEES